ncbi:uncharacterized protein LODBEIA_P27700 [Lodderomyces beijingensis]|uniref:tRNA N(3)-methylcytidine methyltransferase n=1 Tax=Lodderomyces beijingensis TaxID=1775926 RepID=A0ABP0ZK76_9ASCO
MTSEFIESTPDVDTALDPIIKETKPPLDSRIGKDAPFVFGQRFLQNENDVFNHNAWDNVEWGEEQINQAKEMIAKQYEEPVRDYEKSLFNANPAKYWDIFYKQNKENFFKDRNWLKIEFPLLFEVTTKEYQEPTTILEIGCGAGNTFFPILSQNENENLKIFACDYSKVAVDLVKSNEIFELQHDKGVAYSSVWDLANEQGELPEDLEPNSVDFVIMIFVFSALHPNQWNQAVSNLSKVLKPGGQILFRDYGRYDLAQVRFKKGRLLQDNFYIRGDGTRVYFFTEEELETIFCKDGGPFNKIKIATDRRLLVNRKKQLKMYRNWLQGVFKA